MLNGVRNYRNDTKGYPSALRAERGGIGAADWAAVAQAIDTRLAELNWRQRELAERAQVSVAIVRELHRNTTQRRRSARTLEALSLTLGWHPEHLDAVLRGHTPPDRGQPVTSPVDPVTARLTSIDRRLAAIERRLDELAARDG